MAEGVGLTIAKIYLNSAHLQHNADPLKTQRAPSGNMINLSMSVHGDPKGAGAAMIMKVRTEPQDDPPYLLEVEMVGVVQQKGEAPPSLSANDFVVHGGAAMMFPFLREAVANLTMRGAFGPIWLDPVNLPNLVASAETDLHDSHESKRA